MGVQQVSHRGFQGRGTSREHRASSNGNGQHSSGMGSLSSLSTRAASVQRSLGGFAFQSKELLEAATTLSDPSGAHPEIFQALEWLGDRVIGLCFAKILANGVCDQRSLGESNHILSLSTRNTYLKQLCATMELDSCVVDKHTGQRPLNTSRADTFEAFAGAVFLDSGYEAAERHFGSQVRSRALPGPAEMATPSTPSELPAGATLLQDALQFQFSDRAIATSCISGIEHGLNDQQPLALRMYFIGNKALQLLIAEKLFSERADDRVEQLHKQINVSMSHPITVRLRELAKMLPEAKGSKLRLDNQVRVVLGALLYDRGYDETRRLLLASIDTGSIAC